MRRRRTRRRRTSSARSATTTSTTIRCSRPRAYRSALPASTWDNSWSGARRRRSSPPRATSARRATSPAASVEELARRKRARDNDASKDKQEMNSEHIVKSFDEELQRLSAVLLRMGGLAEAQLSAAIEALVRRDSDLAQKVVAGDEAIDQMDVELDDNAVRTLALRQPMANDLREVIAALKISRDRKSTRLNSSH